MSCILSLPTIDSNTIIEIPFGKISASCCLVVTECVKICSCWRVYMHSEPKSYKLKLLKKSVVQHGKRAFVWWEVMSLNLTTVGLFPQCIKPTYKPKKEATSERGCWRVLIHHEPKSYKLKLLGKLVVQQFLTIFHLLKCISSSTCLLWSCLTTSHAIPIATLLSQ